MPLNEFPHVEENNARAKGTSEGGIVRGEPAQKCKRRWNRYLVNVRKVEASKIYLSFNQIMIKKVCRIMRDEVNQSWSGSMSSSIFSGTPLAPSMLAAWPSRRCCTLLSSWLPAARGEDFIVCCIGVADSDLMPCALDGPPTCCGEADAREPLSDAAPPECKECWELVRGDTRPFWRRLVRCSSRIQAKKNTY